MCLIAFACDVGRHALVFAGNRDERYARPTANAAWWSDAPSVLGGRDLEQGGSWLLLTRTGRFAAVTNVRRPPLVSGPRSRGLLCTEFAMGDAAKADFAQAARDDRANLGGFNLLIGDGLGLVYVGSEPDAAPRSVSPGIHGLSNATLDVEWPKVKNAKRALERAIALDDEALVTSLFDMLADRSLAPDAELPSTGVPIELERMLSPIFIASTVYGTRASTVILIDRQGEVRFEERTFGPDGVVGSTIIERFAIGRPRSAT